MKKERAKLLFEQKALGDAIISRRYMISKFGLGNFSVICNNYNQHIFNDDKSQVIGLPLRKDQRKLSNIIDIVLNYKNTFFMKADIYLIASSVLEYIFCILYFPFSRIKIVFLHDFENLKPPQKQISVYSKILEGFTPDIISLADIKPNSDRINIVIDAGKMEKEITDLDFKFIKSKYKDVVIHSFRKYSDFRSGYSIISNSITFAEEFLLIDNADILFMDSYYSHFFSEYFPNKKFYVYFRTGYPSIWCPIGAVGLLSSNLLKNSLLKSAQ